MNLSQKSQQKFYCEVCDYNTSHKNDYSKHILTLKHKKRHILNNLEQKNPEKPIFKCDNCDKIYGARNSLWYHKKKCINSNNIIDTNNTNEMNIINALLKDSSEMKQIMLKICENGFNSNNNSHNTTTTNSHNKSFNLNFFLNETCKNAMDISKFVSLIKPTLEDLEKVGRVGYAEGISSIINNKLKVIDVTERPFHCSDLKREVFHIKENGEWNKETENKPILTKAIKQVAHANMSNILDWSNTYPDCKDADSRKNTQYLNIVCNSMSGTSSDETNKNIEKIISNISKSVIIDK